MKSKLPLLLGGLAGVLVPVTLIGLLAWAGSDPTPAPRAETVVPVPAPSMEHELATTVAPPAPASPPAAPEPVVEDNPYEPELRTRGDVRVRRLILATGVSRHEPTGAADVFTLQGQERLYAFVEAVNASGEAVELDVTFEPPTGEIAGHVALDVPARARRFRTWAYTRHVYEPGRWDAVVRSPDGRVLARRAFDVER
ncbi:MAG: DUF2914 domain-containing protein [Sandaracinaceae bacterium]